MAINPSEDNHYIPGVCNIGKAEIAKRRRDAYIGLAITIIAAALMLYFHTAKPWRLIIFLPALGFFIGALQVYFKFCAGFGWKGVFNFGDLGSTFTVEQQEYFKKDRQKALQIFWLSLLFSAILTSVFFVI